MESLANLLIEQAQWLAPSRSRLLRRVDIARRRSILDLGCGSGAVTEELSRRSGSRVIALDCSASALRSLGERGSSIASILATAEQLPFRNATFDLVFCQFALLWMNVTAAVQEIRRVLMPTGALVALEPDYGAMIEHPPEIATRDLWLSAIRRAGGDPLAGRKLPSILSTAGFNVEVGLLDHLAPPSPRRFDFLESLPLSETEKAALEIARQADAKLAAAARVAHLPIFLIHAELLS